MKVILLVSQAVTFNKMFSIFVLGLNVAVFIFFCCELNFEYVINRFIIKQFIEGWNVSAIVYY